MSQYRETPLQTALTLMSDSLASLSTISDLLADWKSVIELGMADSSGENLTKEECEIIGLNILHQLFIASNNRFLSPSSSGVYPWVNEQNYGYFTPPIFQPSYPTPFPHSNIPFHPSFMPPYSVPPYSVPPYPQMGQWNMTGAPLASSAIPQTHQPSMRQSTTSSSAVPVTPSQSPLASSRPPIKMFLPRRSLPSSPVFTSLHRDSSYFQYSSVSLPDRNTGVDAKDDKVSGPNEENVNAVQEPQNN